MQPVSTIFVGFFFDFWSFWYPPLHFWFLPCTVYLAISVGGDSKALCSTSGFHFWKRGGGALCRGRGGIFGIFERQVHLVDRLTDYTHNTASVHAQLSDCLVVLENGVENSLGRGGFRWNQGKTQEGLRKVLEGVQRNLKEFMKNKINVFNPEKNI